MMRYSIFLLTVLALAVFGLARSGTAHTGLDRASNVTVIYQTAFLRGEHPVTLESCAREDCSDTVE